MAVATALLGAGLVVAALRGGSYDVTPRLETSIAIWWVLGLSFAFGLLPAGRMGAGQRVAALALLGLAAWTAIGLLWTGSAERTVLESLRVLAYSGVALLVAWTFRARDRPRLVAVVGMAGVLVCVLALIARLAPEVLESALAKSGYATSRLDFPFNYWNALGCWAAMTLALALALSAHARTWWQRGAWLAAASIAPVVIYLTYSRAAALEVLLACVLVTALSSRRWLIAVDAIVAAAASVGVVLVIRGVPAIARGTGTHGRATVAIALLAAVVAVFAVSALLPHARLAGLRLPRRIWNRLGLALLAAILVGGVVAGPRLARDAWSSFQRPDTRVTVDPARRLTTLGGNRHDLWPAAVDVFRHEPLHGIGAGTFEFAWDADPRRSGHVIDAHSLYLESLAEVGVPGALLVLLALGALLVAAVRAAFREGDGPGRGAAAGATAALALFCVAAGVDWMWESTAVALAAIVLGTVAAAPVARAVAAAAAPDDAVAAPARVPPGRRRLARTAGAVVALVAVLVQLPALISASQVRASQREVAGGQLVAALADANAAASSAPWAATGELQRALVLERVGRLGVAEQAAARATGLEPRNWALWLVLGRIRAERGRLNGALAAVARARELNPRSPLFQRGVATRLVRPSG
jgi:hypothetical protein